MDFELSEDTLMLRDMLRRFVDDEAKPLEMKFFATGALEAKERARLRTVIEQMGLWGLTTPERYGGGGLDMVTACLLEEEMGKTFLPVEWGDVPPLLYACHDEQVNRYLKPALAGKRHPILALREPSALRPENWCSTARQQGDIFILDGIKALSMAPSADDFFVVFARSEHGVSAFFVESNQPGATVRQNGSVALHLEACQVNRGALLGEDGQAFLLGAAETPHHFIRLGARAIGQSQRLLEMAAMYARDWQALGAAIKERPAIQRMLAEADVQIEAARWLVYHAAWLADKNQPVRIPAAQVRLAAGEMLKRVTDLVTMIYGGAGPSPELEKQRFVLSLIPMDALELGLDSARKIIAGHILASGEDKKS